MIKNLKYILIALVVFSGTLYYFFYNSDSSSKPRVLGLSVNNFYANKNIDIADIPQKKEGISDPVVLSDAAVLLENKTKYPLYAKNEHNPVAIASITKVMTYLIARDNFEIEEVVTVGSDAVAVTGSKINLKEGETITVGSLLEGLLINSGNDAAYALAHHMGSLDEFISKMNEKAMSLGMNDSHFVDPAGLDDKGRSSAFDVAILFSYALNDELFRGIVNTSEKEIFSLDNSIAHSLKNSNRLTTGEIPMDGIIGGKTGFTFDAGHTLVCAAERDNHTLISVILKTSVNTKTASALESQKILNWGFDSYIF